MYSPENIIPMYVRPLTATGMFFNSLNSGVRSAAHPYIGNIHNEEFPRSDISLLCNDLSAVNVISMHHPIIPHNIKSCKNF